MTDDLFSPAVVARVTRQTSLDAKASVEPRAPNLRTRIWRLLNVNGPSTPDEVAALMGESILSVRPMFTYMTKENKISETGQLRRNESGRQAMVWRANPPELWRNRPEHLTAQERIDRLTERVAYLELLLTKEGIRYD